MRVMAPQMVVRAAAGSSQSQRSDPVAGRFGGEEGAGCGDGRGVEVGGGVVTGELDEIIPASSKVVGDVTVGEVVGGSIVVVGGSQHGPPSVVVGSSVVDEMSGSVEDVDVVSLGADVDVVDVSGELVEVVSTDEDVVGSLVVVGLLVVGDVVTSLVVVGSSVVVGAVEVEAGVVVDVDVVLTSVVVVGGSHRMTCEMSLPVEWLYASPTTGSVIGRSLPGP
jgi:hypothetical protein